jgi:hypothetical protein
MKALGALREDIDDTMKTLDDVAKILMLFFTKRKIRR